MRIAIIGAGFAGLSVAGFLLELGVSQVVVFEAGEGASSVAAGLLHPYVGEEGKRSLHASEALEKAREWIALIEKEQQRAILTAGVERVCLHPEQRALFLDHEQRYGDIEFLEQDRILIRSGWTVDCPAYLEGLKEKIKKGGGLFIQQKVHSLEELKGFDQIVVAAGAGSLDLVKTTSLPVSILKGQVIACESEGEPPLRSRIGKGYVARSGNSSILYVGSTYERQWTTVEPDLDFAAGDLFPKVQQLFPQVCQWTVKGCRAALRVIRKGHYFPILAKEGERTWIFTALGSRGLLYHAFLGRKLAEAIVQGDASLLT